MPVTLEVTLDGQGGLAGPPRILRPGGGRPSEQRLLAEAQALEAIRACLPYEAASLPGLGRRYRVGFGGDGAKNVVRRGQHFILDSRLSVYR